MLLLQGASSSSSVSCATPLAGIFSKLLGFHPAEGDDLEFATEVDAVVLLGGVEVG